MFWERIINYYRRRNPSGSGLIPQQLDNRDYKYHNSGGTIETAIDLSSDMNKVYDQGSSNACTAFAVVDLLDYYLAHKKLVTWNGFHSSQLFLWYMSRYEEGTQSKNVGVVLRSVFKVITKYGFVPYERHPFTRDWFTAPDEKTIISGGVFKLYLKTIPKYYLFRTYRNDFIDSLKDSLSNNGPVVFAFPIRKELSDCKKDSAHIKSLSGSISGYHAMTIIGYGDGYFKVKNSWGCYDKDTRVLTSKGFKYFKDLQGDELLATLNKKGELEYQKSEHHHEYKYNGKLHHYKSSKIDCLVTPNHNMYYRTRCKSWNLKKSEEINNKRVIFKRDTKWNGNNTSIFNLPSVVIKKTAFTSKETGKLMIKMKYFLPLLGYYLSEGSCYKTKNKGDGSSYVINIAQTKPHTKKIMRKNLAKLPFNITETNKGFIISNYQLYCYLKKFGKCNSKYIPKDILLLSKNKLQLLYDSLMLGDGSIIKSVNGSNKVTYYTTSNQLKDDFVELCLKIGLSSNVYIDDRVGSKSSRGYNYNFKCYQIRVNGSQGRGSDTIVDGKELIDYNGIVYCETVPNGTLFVERNGKHYWSGNSRWGLKGYCYISEELIKEHAFDVWTLKG